MTKITSADQTTASSLHDGQVHEALPTSPRGQRALTPDPILRDLTARRADAKLDAHSGQVSQSEPTRVRPGGSGVSATDRSRGLHAMRELRPRLELASVSRRLNLGAQETRLQRLNELPVFGPSGTSGSHDSDVSDDEGRDRFSSNPDYVRYSDSEVSDDSDLDLEPYSDLDEDILLDNDLMQSRFEVKTSALFDDRETILANHREAAFSQADLLMDLVPDEGDQPGGMCLGLSLEWLMASHAHPDQSTAQRAQYVSSGERARRALNLQRTYLQTMMPFQDLHNMKRAIAKAGLEGIELERYRKAETEGGYTIADIGVRASRLILRGGPYNLLAMKTNLTGHAIACAQKPDGRFSVLDPDTGAYEAPPDKLAELLAGIFAAHVISAKEDIEREATSNEMLAKLLHDQGPLEFDFVKITPVRLHRA